MLDMSGSKCVENPQRSGQIFRDPEYDVIVNLVHRDAKDVEDSRDWTKVHAFYAAMGGFAFDSRDVESFIHGASTRVFLTPKGVRFLFEHEARFGEVVPKLTSGQIKDKSKVGSFGKGLLCLQAGWFCLQSITRVAYSLHLSLLEINTIAHSMCALLVYCLWWKKPFGIEEPTITTEGMDICAYMCMCSAFSMTSANHLDLILEFERIQYHPAGNTTDAAIRTEPHNRLPARYLDASPTHEQASRSLTDPVNSSEPTNIKLQAGQSLLATGFKLRGNSRRFHDRGNSLHTRESFSAQAGIILPNKLTFK
ncbi:hypothetical protein LTR10_008111 [Elasticomyces elasticus]|nr:hypothetical protein LTR10_008111 [Elasticomyces elasticus]